MTMRIMLSGRSLLGPIKELLNPDMNKPIHIRLIWSTYFEIIGTINVTKYN